MFETTPPGRLLDDVRAHEFGDDPVFQRGGDRIEAIRELDRAVRAAQAEQIVQIVALLAERTMLMGVGQGDPALSVIGEVAMARNIGPTAAGTQIGIAVALTHLPRVFELFAAGLISEATVRAITTETAVLSVDDKTVADPQIAEKILGMTTFQARLAAARIVISIDAEAAHERARRNRADARVSMFPEPDGVATLHVRGPAEQILAAYKALDEWATGLRATGDPRTRGQIMSATLVERVTGLKHADDIGVEIHLVLDARTLLADGETPVDLEGYGPICPDVAEDIIARAPNASIRRLLVDPVDGTLIVREPRRRRFDGPTAAHIRIRDRWCRQPGCDRKIGHNDHILAHQHGGLSVKENGQGVCPGSHTIKHLPGWSARSDGKTVIWRTPTGHEYRSDPPPVLPHRRQ